MLTARQQPMLQYAANSLPKIQASSLCADRSFPMARVIATSISDSIIRACTFTSGKGIKSVISSLVRSTCPSRPHRHVLPYTPRVDYIEMTALGQRHHLELIVVDQENGDFT
ncbi:hypothetical protein ACVWZ6_004583 [Bradyrhizobium sp. GM6.1]